MKKRYAKRLAEIDADLNRAKDENNTVEIDQLEHEKMAIIKEVQRLVGLGGKARRHHPDEKARSSVKKAIRRVIDSCSSQWHLPKFGAHLETYLSTGAHCAYRPSAPHPDWRF